MLSLAEEISDRYMTDALLANDMARGSRDLVVARIWSIFLAQ